jgi:hypothetical protein
VRPAGAGFKCIASGTGAPARRASLDGEAALGA